MTPAILPLPCEFRSLRGAACRLPGIHVGMDPHEYFTPEGRELASRAVDVLRGEGSLERLISWLDEQGRIARANQDGSASLIGYSSKVRILLHSFDDFRQSRIHPFTNFSHFLWPDQLSWDGVPEVFHKYIPYLERLRVEWADKMFRDLTYEEWGDLELLYEDFEAGGYRRYLHMLDDASVTLGRETHLIYDFLVSFLECAAEVRANWDLRAPNQSEAASSEASLAQPAPTYCDPARVGTALEDVVVLSDFDPLVEAQQRQRSPDPVSQFDQLVEWAFDPKRPDVARSVAFDLAFERPAESLAEANELIEQRFAILDAVVRETSDCEIMVQALRDVVCYWFPRINEDPAEQERHDRLIDPEKMTFRPEEVRPYLAALYSYWVASAK